MTIEQKTKSLTPEQLAEWQLIDAEWVAGFSIPGIGAIPPHARLEGYFAGEPTDPEKAPTYFTLRIPEGWESNGRLLVSQPPGFANHLDLGEFGPTELAKGKATVNVNTLDLSKIFLSPNTAEEFQKRMNQAVHRLKAFLNNVYGRVTFTYGGGFSRGAIVMSLAGEEVGQPYDGMLLESGQYAWDTVLRTYPLMLRSGRTVADHPALERPIRPGALAFLAFVLQVLLQEVDPDYLSSGGKPGDYDLTTRPRNIQNYVSSKKLATDGSVQVKTILLHGLNDDLAPTKRATDYFKEILGQGRLDLARLYLSKNYDHGFFFNPDISNAVDILERWVEHNVEPGNLVTVRDPGGLQHSKAVGFEADPVAYALSVNGS